MADLFRDILRTIDNKEYNYFDENQAKEELKDYVPFVVNKAYSFGLDSLLYSNEINCYHELNHKMQYDFYYYGVSKRSRYNGKYWKLKRDKSSDLIIKSLAKFYKCSTSVAARYQNLHSDKELKLIHEKMKEYDD